MVLEKLFNVGENMRRDNGTFCSPGYTKKEMI
jgi:hypothetical protein